MRRQENARIVRPVAFAHERCQVDAVVGSRLAQQPAYVGRHGWYANAQVVGDLTIRSGQHDPFDHLLLTRGKLRGRIGQAGIADLQGRSMSLLSTLRGAQMLPLTTTSIATRTVSISEFEIKIGSGPGRDRLYCQIVVYLRADNQQADAGTRIENGMDGI